MSQDEGPRTVWWYQVDPSADWQEIEMSVGATLLHYRGGAPGHGRLWAEVDPDAEPEIRRVGVFGTGWIVPSGGTYVATDVGPTGYVWHLYDGGPA